MNRKRWFLVMALSLAVAVSAPLILIERPAQATAEAMLADACELHNDIQSFKLTISATQYESDEMESATTEIRSEGGYNRHIVTTTDKGEREETIVTENASYHRIEGTDTWEKTLRTPRVAATRQNYNATDNFCGYPALMNIRLVGEEDLDGSRVIHISARTDMDRKASVVWPPEFRDSPARQQFIAGEESVEFWIDEKLGLPLQIKHVASFPQVGDDPPYGFDATLRYWDFNVPMGITVPSNVADKPLPPPR